jgi:Immunity protein 52
MTSDPYRIQSYWLPRPESTRACAVRLARMLEGLAGAHPAFARWNKKAKTRAAANKQAWAMPPDIDELTAVFEKGRRYRDIPRDPWPEMGYSVSAWNGLDPPYGASLAVRPGGYTDSPPFPNTADLRLKPASAGNTDLISVAALKPALLSLAAAWEPDYGVVVSWDYWQRLFGEGHYPLFRSGWMTYLAPQYASRITPPPAAIVEPVPGGGFLLLATEEQFSMDNPAHLVVADAIQAALAPLETLLPAGRDANLRQRSKS